MKTTALVKVTHQPADPEALSLALRALESNAREQTRRLNIVIPEAEGIKSQEGYYGCVDRILSVFLRDPKNRSTQLWIAIHELGELQRQAAELVQPLVRDAEAMEIALNDALRGLVHHAKAVCELHLQAWFSKGNLPLALSRAELVIEANGLVQRVTPSSWAFSLNRVVQEVGLGENRNTGIEAANLYRAQLASFNKAKPLIEELVKKIEAAA